MLWGRLRAGRRALWRGGAGLPATRGADGGDRAADRGVRPRGRAELRRASKREMKCAGKAGKHLVAQPPSGVAQHLWSIWHEASTCHVRSCATCPCQIDSSRDGRVEPPKGPGSWGAQVALLNASAPACSIDRFQAGAGTTADRIGARPIAALAVALDTSVLAPSGRPAPCRRSPSRGRRRCSPQAWAPTAPTASRWCLCANRRASSNAPSSRRWSLGKK